MFNLKSAWAGLCSAVFICNLSYAAEIGHVPISLDNTLTHSHTTQGLEPIQASYQIAKLQFLPDLKDSETGWAGNKIGGTYNKNDCSAYPLKSCPTGAKCSKCPVGPGYKINSCSAPFILSEGACVCPPIAPLVYPNDICVGFCAPRAGASRRCIAKSCTPSPDQTGCTRGTQACDDGCGKLTRKCCNPCTNTVTTKPANSSYVYSSCIDGDGIKNIQTGWKCNSGYHKSADGKSCIKDCNVTNCAGYTLTSCPANGNCSSCSKRTASCLTTSGLLYKLDSCKTGYHKNGDSLCDKDCKVNNCEDYPLSSKPANATWAACTITTAYCSTVSIKYKIISCDAGYTLSDEKCVLSKTPQQKCLDEGYRLKEDWPKPTTASNETVIPSSMLANFMKNIFELKFVHAAPTLTTAITNPLNTVVDPILPVGPITGGNTKTNDMGTYTFTVTSTCPYDSNYVKGVWKITGGSNSGTGGGSSNGCSSNMVRRVCNNINYCCPSNATPSNCDQIKYQCLRENMDSIATDTVY